jgi:hypothetical protein
MLPLTVTVAPASAVVAVTVMVEAAFGTLLLYARVLALNEGDRLPVLSAR